MKENHLFVGVDVSKATLDICQLNAQSVKQECIKNDLTAIKSLCLDLQKCNVDIYVGMENTGRYGMLLLGVLQQFNFKVYVINPLHLAKSMGLSRVKTDKADAQKIARFVMRNHPDLQRWTPRQKSIEELSVLLTERRSLVKMLKQTKARIKELDTCKTMSCYEVILTSSKQQIDFLSQQIKGIEKQIRLLIKQKNELQQRLELLISVRGVGEVLAWYMLVKTNNFSTITNPRKFACHAGVVPFKKESGTSIVYKPKLSVYGDKEMKSLLHLAAISIIRVEGEMKDYYDRKVAEGKSKMKVINALRNKIVHRIFAVIRDNRSYQHNLTNHLFMS